MSKMTLWLIRHGESYGNTGEVTDNPQASRLTEKGRLQANHVATQINKPPTIIISSPAQRTQETSLPIQERWPNSTFATWPIQELIYLSPARYLALNNSERKLAIQSYWHANDPTLCDGYGAESFVEFLTRVEQFHLQLQQLRGFVVVVGHRMFFNAYRFCIMNGFSATPSFMAEFHHFEITHPIENGEILKSFLEN